MAFQRGVGTNSSRRPFPYERPCSSSTNASLTVDEAKWMASSPWSSGTLSIHKGRSNSLPRIGQDSGGNDRIDIDEGDEVPSPVSPQSPGTQSRQPMWSERSQRQEEMGCNKSIPGSPRVYRTGYVSSSPRAAGKISRWGQTTESSPTSYSSSAASAPGRRQSDSATNRNTRAQSSRAGKNLMWPASWLASAPSKPIHASDRRRVRPASHRQGSVPHRPRQEHPTTTLMLRHTPVLTLILLKLHESLGGYCETLASPAASGAAAAAKLLETGVATATSSPNSSAGSSPGWEGHHSALPSSSPKSVPSPKSSHRRRRRRQNAPASHGAEDFDVRSLPLPQSLSWSPPDTRDSPPLSSRTTPVGTGSSGSAIALEAEWDKFTSPFVLLAGAEALYARLEHVVVDAGRDTAARRGVRSPTPTRGRGGLDRALGWTFQARSSMRVGGGSGDVEGSSRDGKMEDAATESGGAQRNDDGKTQRLLAMYKRVREDLIIVREILCDPILGGGREGGGGVPSDQPISHGRPNVEATEPQSCAVVGSGRAAADPPPASPTSNNKAYGAASSLSATVESILELINARQGLIEVHADLFATPQGGGESFALSEATGGGGEEKAEPDSQPPCWLELSKRCDKLLTLIPLPSDDDTLKCGSSLPIIQSFREEVRAHSAALAACHYVNRCSFFEGIVHVRKLKVHLSSSAMPSSLQMWLRSVLAGLLSAMPITFDRIDAFSSPLYGFQKQFFSLEGGGSDGTVEVGVFRRRRSSEEQQGGRSRKVPQSPESVDGVLQATHGGSPRTDHQPGADSLDDFDATFRELLRKHESKGGSPMAVSVILDAESAGQSNYERGYSSKTNQKSETDPSSDAQHGQLREWPAIYMRTTLHSGASSMGDPTPAGGSGVASIMRRSGNNLLGRRSGLFHSQTVVNAPSNKQLVDQSVSRLSNAQTVSLSKSSPRGGDRRQSKSVDSSAHSRGAQKARDSRLNVLEYDPKSGHVNWPYTEWPHIVPLFAEYSENFSQQTAFSEQSEEHTVLFGRAVTIRETSQRRFTLLGSDEGPDSDHFSSMGDSLFSVGKFPSMANIASLVDGGVVGEGGGTTKTDSNSPLTSSPRQHQGQGTSAYHFVRLNQFMWVVVVVKGEEEKWHRRRSRGLPDDEIRSFLDEVAPQLSLHRLFGAGAVVAARTASQRLELPSLCHGIAFANLWSGGVFDDTDSHRFLSSVKSMLGLRPRSPLTQPLKSPYRSSSSRSSRLQHQNRAPPDSFSDDDRESRAALAFFMGHDLCRCLGQL